MTGTGEFWSWGSAESKLGWQRGGYGWVGLWGWGTGIYKTKHNGGGDN